MRRPKRLSWTVLVLSVWVLSSCESDSTGTPGGLTPQDFLEAAGEAVETVGAALLENEAATTLNVLGFYITSVTSQPTLAASSGAAKVPAGALGGTFVYDDELYAYVLDEAATGAPADGVRFLLYEVDEFTYQPVNPLNQIGHIDIRDLSVGDNLDIRHEVVIGGATVLAFSVTGMVTETSGDLTTSGSVDDGTLTADFTFDIAVGETTGTQFTVDVTSGAYQLLWDYVRSLYDTGPGSDAITISESTSGGKVELLVNWDSQYLGTGVVEFNDQVVADVTGSGGFIEVVPRSGSGLTEFDGYEIAGGYFQLYVLEAHLIELTVFGLLNTGRNFPYVY